MAGFFTSAVSFIVAIAILVAVHEWGHYIVARWMGVKVLRFSIGFGRVLWSGRYGEDETEFCVSAIPIGGYVKLLDERDCAVPLNEQHRALNRKSGPAKVAILAAGPGLNFLFAIVAYWCMFVIGVPGAKPLVGEVEPDSIAAAAGLLSGDEVLRVGDRPVGTWEGTILAMLNEMLSDGDIPLTVRRESAPEVSITLRSAGRESELTEPGQLFNGLGFRPWSPRLPPVIDVLTSGGPAERAGFEPGDLVLRAEGAMVESWPDWVDFVRARPNQRIEVVVERDGIEVPLSIEIGEIDVDGEAIGRIGASVRVPEDLLESMRAEQRYGVGEALGRAVAKTWEMMALTVRMIFSMVIGDVSVKNISGPINIAQYAGVSASIGMVQFLSFLAIVSISLGILNLLPIPMLDGGQIFYQLIEGAKGSPMSEKAQLIGQQMGIVFLLLLMSFAFYNDLARIFG
ncbi:MAG: RIP metalloprotease RseP [Gammaproteobacteria bacterium]